LHFGSADLKSSKPPTAAMASERARKELPDLILCDHQHGQGGRFITRCSRLRGEAVTAAIPFI